MCGHHRRRNEVRWVRDPDLRASQQERERVVDQLRTHAGEGRLELDELEERIELALHARTRGELTALLRDLPRLTGRAYEGRRRTVARASMAMAFLPLVVAIVLFSAAPPMIAWLGWPILGFWLFGGLPGAGMGFAWCGLSKRRHERRTVVV
jgi:Domain of unknown function (DUF1707)